MDKLFEYNDGLHLRGTPLWIDAKRSKSLCFLSSARRRRLAAHSQIICTEHTAQLLQATRRRASNASLPALVSPYHRRFALGQLELELLPAGYVLGSAALLARFRGKRILYLGRVNLDQRNLIEVPKPTRCDVLFFAGSLDDPDRQGSYTRATTAELAAFCERAFDDGRVPILLCPPIGEAQVIARMLLTQGIETNAHWQVFAACRVYGQALPAQVGANRVQRYASVLRPADRRALLWPAHLAASPALERQKHQRRALVAANPTCYQSADRHKNAAIYRLRMSPTRRSLVDYIRQCQPKQAYLAGHRTHQSAAQALERSGIAVTLVDNPRQLSLFSESAPA